MAHRPTPHSIAVAALIALHCQEPSPLYPEENSDFGLVDAFLRDLLLQRDNDTQWSSWHGSRIHALLQQLETSLGGSVGSRIAHQFHAWLKVAASSIDTLTDLLTAIQHAISDRSVDSASTYGVFMRSCLLGYDELSFESVIDLWKDFRNEVFDTEGICEQHWTRSSAQMESAIRDQCWKSGSAMGGSIHPDGTDLCSIQTDLQHVLRHNPELPAAHFLNFALCLQSGERAGAVDALHQYMDYALSTECGGEDILQFAAILLTVLHDQFGEGQLVSAATEEAVCVAQQSQDVGAVAFALGWLAAYASDNDSTTKRGLMQRCVQRAGMIRPLAAGASLSLAATTHSWTGHSLAVSDQTGTDSSSRSAGASGDRPTHGGHIDSNLAGTAVTAAQQKLVAAGLWNHFGETTLSLQSSVSALSCHGDRMSSADIRVAIQNLSCAATSGSLSVAMYEQAMGLSTNSLVCSTNCVYGNFIRTFVVLRGKYDLPVDGVFLFDVAVVLHEWAVRRGELEHAEAIMLAMESHLHPRLDGYQEIIFDIESQKALLLSRQGRWEETMAFLRSAIAKYKSKSQHGFVARLLLQLSMARLESNQGQFTSTLRPLLECLALSKKQKMDGLHNAALSILAQVHLRQGHCQRAESVLQTSLPTLLRQGHVWLQAEALLTLAKCRGQQAKEYSDHSPKRNKMLRSAIQELVRCESLFLRCQDCHRLKEVYYIMARTYNELDDGMPLRDKAARNFTRCSPVSSSPTTDTMSAMCSRDGILRLSERAGICL